MNITYRGMNTSARKLALITALFTQTLFVSAAHADAPVANTSENWEDISKAFTQEIGAYDNDSKSSPYLRRCLGLIVTPKGDLVMQTAQKGICVSRDQGTTWSVVADNNVLGRCENGWSYSVPYPYDGRMIFFAYDGKGGLSGGISLDDAKTWRSFGQLRRGVELGDADWSVHDPQTIFALTHEPFFSILSNDGGKSWQRLDPTETGRGPEVQYGLGMVDSKTLLRGDPKKQGGVIELSSDAGQTWTPVANYQIVGRSPVHYGKNLYWATTQGVIVSSNGKDWTLTGSGAEGAAYGPYFGSSEQEFVIVTHKSFLKTEDGGKTWTPIAKYFSPSDNWHSQPMYSYYGWDPVHNILYASGLASSVYRLKL